MTILTDSFLGDRGLHRVLADLSFKALDVGARGGFLTDLAPIAHRVDAIGFEPDREECHRLNAEVDRQKTPWRSIRFLPLAVGKDEELRTLNLYRQRGCSSFLQANVELARQFTREDYFFLDGTMEVPTIPLDTAAARYDFQDAVFLKLDIQGSELEALVSGKKLMSESVLVVRLEVEFAPQYHAQPLFSDIDDLLQGHGMVAMEFVHLSEWRRSTKAKNRIVRTASIPYSRGQLIHADVIYFKDAERLNGDSDDAILQQLKAAFLAIVYEQVDHAAYLLGGDAVRRFVETRYGFDVTESMDVVSRRLGRMYQSRRWRQVAREIRSLIWTRI